MSYFAIITGTKAITSYSITCALITENQCQYQYNHKRVFIFTYHFNDIHSIMNDRKKFN